MTNPVANQPARNILTICDGEVQAVEAAKRALQNPSGSMSHFRELDEQGVREWQTPPTMSRQEARAGLIRVAENEYSVLTMRNNPARLLSPALAVAGSFVSGRISNSVGSVRQNRGRINEVGRGYGIPPEVIGSIVFQEQLTQSIPDWSANLNTSLGGNLFFWRSGNYHSTGLGAIFPQTARPAWNFVNPDRVLPETNRELQRMLTLDNDFNVETIAVVLIHKAYDEGYISHPTSTK